MRTRLAVLVQTLLIVFCVAILRAAAAAPDYRGRWFEGSGDRTVLEAVDAACESLQPSAKMACLPLLYKRDWDGFVAGPPWPC